MSLEEKKLLTDIAESIDSIDEHLEHRRLFDEYKANKTKRRAVERELEIIGEAVNLIAVFADDDLKTLTVSTSNYAYSQRC